MKIRKRFYLPLVIALLSGYLIAVISPNVEVQHVYKIFPAFIVYTDKFIPEGGEGRAIGIVALIRPRSREIKTLKKHELIHVKQCYRYGLYNWLPSLFTDRFEAKFEAEAYATQMFREEDAPLWAKFIKEEYNYSIPEKDIEEYLVYYWKKQKSS